MMMTIKNLFILGRVMKQVYFQCIPVKRKAANISYLTAWAADSVDDWSLSDPDDVDSLTEFEIVDEDSTVLESQSSDSSSSLEITVSNKLSPQMFYF